MKAMKRRHFIRLSGLGFLSQVSRGYGGMYGAPGRAVSSFKPDERYDPWIELNMAHLAWNLNQIKKAVKVPVMGVIKGNAYGHGLVEIGRALEKHGVDQLMVAKLQEAVLLRESDVRVPILNFGPLHESDAEVIIQHDISQSVFTDEVEGLNVYAAKKGKKVKVHIHVDTGMTRMGIPYREALPYIEAVSKLEGIALRGISSTFTEGEELDKDQLRIFIDVCRKAKAKDIRIGLRHIASSDAVLDMPESYLDMVRPGICLYGAYPNQKTQEEDPLKLMPVMQLKCRVVAVKTLEPGDGVSYHHRYKANKREKVAILAVGYSDGYPPRAIGKAQVLIQGKRHPLIASITANHCEVLLDETSSVKAGDEVVLLGAQGKESIWSPEIGEWDGTSSYKITFGMSPFLPRLVVG
jgi:alanine racemase